MRTFCMLFLLAVAIAPPAAEAHSHKRKGLEIVHPWTSATAAAGAAVAVCMKIKNRSGAPERLLSASTVAAAKTELQEPEGEGAAAGDRPRRACPGWATSGTPDLPPADLGPCAGSDEPRRVGGQRARRHASCSVRTRHR